MNPPLPEIPAAAPSLGALLRLRTRAILVATVFTLLTVLGALLDPARLLRSYLVAFVFWLSIALGGLAIAMMSQLVPGGWSIVLRRPLEAASRTIAPLSLLFLPLLFSLKSLYPWARPGAALEDPELATKMAYLNVPFFVARSIVYFAIWAVLAWLLSRLSARQDTSLGDADLARRIRKWSAVGLCLYCTTMTFAAIDWMMSLSPRWSSTIYGVYLIGGQGVAGMAFAILCALLLVREQNLMYSNIPAKDRPPSWIPGGTSGVLARPHHFHDAGKMLLAFVMLWAYFAISQLLVMWSGNLPEEIPYYVKRLGDGYRPVSIALLLFHFALPFFLLLSRDLKRDARRLALVAALLLVMRWVDFYWLIRPSADEGTARFSWLDPVAFLAIGGIWTALFVTELGRRSLLPLGEPMLGEAFEDNE